MLGSALRDGSADRQCVFEVFARRLPDGRRYGVVAGTGRVLDAIARLPLRRRRRSSFLRDNEWSTRRRADYLADYRFRGDVDGYPEGELYFPYSPCSPSRARFAEAVVLETLVLSILNHDCAIASAAARMVAAAGGRPIIEMGSRRTHEQAAVAAARAAYLAGFASTSNLAAARRYGVPTAGTAAHAFTLLHDDERAAFAAQLATMGTGTTLLVDTYDITRGIELAVEVAGPALGAVRIDSGDLGVMARHAREQLDGLGATGTRIVVSGDLDEFAIAALAARPGGRLRRRDVGRHRVRRADRGHGLQARRGGRPAGGQALGAQGRARAAARRRCARTSRAAPRSRRSSLAGGAADTGRGRAAAAGAAGARRRAGRRPADLDEAREHLRAATVTLPWDGLKLSRGEPAIPTRVVGLIRSLGRPHAWRSSWSTSRTTSARADRWPSPAAAEVARAITAQLAEGGFDHAVATRDHHIDPGAHFSDHPDFVDTLAARTAWSARPASTCTRSSTRRPSRRCSTRASTPPRTRGSRRRATACRWPSGCATATSTASRSSASPPTTACAPPRWTPPAQGFATTVRLDLTAGVARPTVTRRWCSSPLPGSAWSASRSWPSDTPDGYGRGMTYGQPPDEGQPTTRFGAPYRDESYGQQGYPPQQGYAGRRSRAISPCSSPRRSRPPRDRRTELYANAYGAPVGSGAQFGVVGTTLAGIGFILLIIALTTMTWFKQGGVSATFSDLSTTLDNNGNAAGIASAYYGWLAWTLAVVGLIVAVAANLPSPASGPLAGARRGAGRGSDRVHLPVGPTRLVHDLRVLRLLQARQRRLLHRGGRVPPDGHRRAGGPQTHLIAAKLSDNPPVR